MNPQVQEAVKLVYKCGEEPGIGIYICNNCGAKKRLDDDTDKLPPCSVCGNCEFEKAY